MTEQELRALVRDAIAQQLGRQQRTDAVPLTFARSDVSFGLFTVPSGTDACIIEPSVPCTHCGYCKSYGH